MLIRDLLDFIVIGLTGACVGFLCGHLVHPGWLALVATVVAAFATGRALGRLRWPPRHW